MKNTITITTTDRKLWLLLHDLQIEGMRRVPHLEHKVAPGGKPNYKIVLAFASGVSINLFSSWLYDHVKSQPEGTTKIENQPVAHDRGQITTIIGEKVIINKYYGEKKPDDERIAEELE